MYRSISNTVKEVLIWTNTADTISTKTYFQSSRIGSNDEERRNKQDKSDVRESIVGWCYNRHNSGEYYMNKTSAWGWTNIGDGICSKCETWILSQTNKRDFDEVLGSRLFEELNKRMKLFVKDK